ncbi:MAG TPA: 30S ribosomal protein S12 methylthiotransferase RimO [Candidatus Angelobacter sp.]|nr:30S ribosomal protein S12 methylthiotransferase RimO [Candidatus Angelobacter sp.]
MPVEKTTVNLPQQTLAEQGEPLKVGFVSLGCPKNLVDSEVMMGLLQSGGAQMTARAEEADVIVVNTCSFIDTAKQESVDTILEMARHKTEGRAKKLVVAGCLVERYRDEIRKNIPEVDAVVGTGELEGILAAAGVTPLAAPAEASPFVILGSASGLSSASALHSAPPLNSSSASQSLKSGVGSRPEGELRESQGRFSRVEWDGAIASLPNYLYNENTPRVLATPKASAYIKIAEGCDHPCGFCVIPQLRGKFRSRHFESVVAEATRLAAGGVREITLIGQDTTCYGEDLGIKDGLALLLERLAQVEDLRWVRFLYAYPNKVTGKLLDTLASSEKICSYIDVPLQHASASVLKRMKRGANADIFLKSIEKMRGAVPGLTLRTSFIVGFPGETEEDFNELCDFVKAAQFDWMGVFSYSDEEGSAAYRLEDKVSRREIERRRRKLMQVQRQISKKSKKKLLGRQFDVLALGPSEETDLLWEGRTAMHAPEIDGKLYINDFADLEPEAGMFYRCEITEAHDYDLVARIV